MSFVSVMEISYTFCIHREFVYLPLVPIMGKARETKIRGGELN